MNPKRSFLYDEIILKSWWTILFFLLCFFAYDRGVHYLNLEKRRLENKLTLLQKEKESALEEKAFLLLQIESQNEPSWVELILMKRLGLVPEGQQKVIFHSKSDR